MTRIRLKSRVGADGILNLRVPVGLADANREVVVTVLPSDHAASANGGREEWLRFVRETAGSWAGDVPLRPSQGAAEQRDEL